MPKIVASSARRGVGTHTITLEATNAAGQTASTAATVVVDGDYDADGMADAAELAEGLNPLATHDAYDDVDGDGLTRIVERARGTDPGRADSDGDGRSDADEIAGMTDPVTSDAPLPADVLTASTEGLDLEGDLSRDVPFPQRMIQVGSRDPVDWTLRADVPWLGASAASGMTPATVTVLVQAHLLGDGTQHGTLTFESAIGSVDVPVTVTMTRTLDHHDADDDGDLTVGDVQRVSGRATVAYGAPSYDRHRDIDRDADIDPDDARTVAARWRTGHGCCTTPPPPAGAAVSLSAPAVVDPGQTFGVDVCVADAAFLGGFEATLTYDPALLELREVASGAFPGSTGRTATLLGPDVDPAAGRVTFGAYSSGSQTAPSGAGTLARLTFAARGTPGGSPLRLDTVLLAKPSGALARADGATASVRVRDVKPPQTTIDSRPGQIIGGFPFNGVVGGTATDDASGVEEVFVRWSYFGAVTFAGAVTLGCDETRRSCTWRSPPPLLKGQYLVRAWSRDGEGNVESPGASTIVYVV